MLVMMRYLEIIQNGRCFHLKAPPMIILCSCREETGIPLPCTQVLGLVLSQFESSSEKCSSQDLSSVQAHKAGQSVRGLVLHVGLLGCSTAPAGLSQGYPTAMCCLTTMFILQSSTTLDKILVLQDTMHWGYPGVIQPPAVIQHHAKPFQQ